MAKKVFGNVEIRSQQELRFFEAVAGGTNKVALKAAAAIGSDFALTLPSAQAANDDILKANSSGELSFGKIVNDNITNATIAYAKLNLADGDIPQAKVNGLVSDLAGKLSTTLADASIFVGNGSNVATAQAVSGDLSLSNTGVATIANNAVSNAKLRDSAALSVIGRASDTSGDPADIEASTDHQVLRRSGTALGFGLISNNNIDSSAAIAFSKLASLSQGSILIGNASNQAEALAIGTNGYVLKSNGTTASWQPDIGSSSYSVDWTDTDGATKTITHSLGSLDVVVQIYDKATGETIEVDSVIRTSTNVVDVTASEAPPATDWRVVIMKA